MSFRSPRRLETRSPTHSSVVRKRVPSHSNGCRSDGISNRACSWARSAVRDPQQEMCGAYWRGERRGVGVEREGGSRGESRQAGPAVPEGRVHEASVHAIGWGHGLRVGSVRSREACGRAHAAHGRGGVGRVMARDGNFAITSQPELSWKRRERILGQGPTTEEMK